MLYGVTKLSNKNERLANASIIILLAVLSVSLIGAHVGNVANAIPIVTLPEITISSNGSIQSSLSPSPIVNEGNMYVITENISDYGIDIQCSNILLLGEGNTLQATVYNNINSGITIEANGVTVENISINAFYVGIDVKGSSNTVTGCTISAYDDGINLEGQSNLVTKNQILDCGEAGVDLFGSKNSVDANTINCKDGFCITVNGDTNTISTNLLISGTFDVSMHGNSNNVTDNTMTGGSHGIVFYDPATANTVDKNDIINNYLGIGLDKQVNTFYLNNLVNNTYNVRFQLYSDPYAPYSLNVFDNGSVGNYWSDYTVKYPNAQEIGNSGAYNTPYVIDGNITDNYPLTTPYTIGSTGAQLSTSSVNPSLSPTPTPTSASSVPELSWLAILPLFISVFFIVVILRSRMTKSRNVDKHSSLSQGLLTDILLSFQLHNRLLER